MCYKTLFFAVNIRAKDGSLTLQERTLRGTMVVNNNHDWGTVLCQDNRKVIGVMVNGRRN